MENLPHTPPRSSSRRAAFVANARLTAMLTPVRGRPAAGNPADEAAVEENVLEFRDEDSLSSVESSETGEGEVECSICLEEPIADDIATIDGCEHQFCLNCITQWSETNNVCPLCRIRFTSIESTGGVLQRVPDRRPAVDPPINLVGIFNLEEVAGGEDEDNDPNPFAVILRRMLEQQEVQLLQMQEMNRQLERTRLIQQNTVQLHLEAERAEGIVQQDVNAELGIAGRPAAELAELNAVLNRIVDNLRSL
ncbi:hypothetical protein ACHAWT_003966 [Skeletonema menzelii]